MQNLLIEKRKDKTQDPATFLAQIHLDRPDLPLIWLRQAYKLAFGCRPPCYETIKKRLIAPPKVRGRPRKLASEVLTIAKDIAQGAAAHNESLTRVELAKKLSDAIETLPIKDVTITAEDIRNSIRRGHLELEMKPPIMVEKSRSDNIDFTRVVDFFIRYIELHLKYRYESFQICNGDETHLGGLKETLRRPKKVLVPLDSNIPPVRKSADSIPGVSVLLWSLASGSLLHTWVMVKQEQIGPRLNEAIFHMHGVPIRSETNTMTKDVFNRYLPQMITGWREGTIQHLMSQGDWRNVPLLIIIDNAPCHNLTEETKAWLRRNHVEVLYLPPHTSHILQVLDLSFNKRLKSGAKPANPVRTLSTGETKQMSTYQVSDTLEAAHQSFANASVPAFGQKAWRSAGLFPFDPSKLDNRAQFPREISEYLKTLAGMSLQDMLVSLRGKRAELLANARASSLTKRVASLPEPERDVMIVQPVGEFAHLLEPE